MSVKISVKRVRGENLLNVMSCGGIFLTFFNLEGREIFHVKA
jgi:hypothetical protein